MRTTARAFSETMRTGHRQHRGLASGALGLATLLFALGCVAGPNAGRGWRNQRPQLYPNEHYRHVGFEVAEADISRCMADADQAVPQTTVAKKAAVNTVGGAAAGAALGALGGAIVGRPGAGAAAGAAVGATAGAGKSVYEGSKPEESYRAWVEACLRDKGYEVTSWR